MLSGAILNKYIPSVVSFVKNTFYFILGKMGGKLAFLAIQGKYLNWVVHKNQDLNLTGIIGTNQKPQLEQIFISLRFKKHTGMQKELDDTDADDSDVELETKGIEKITSNTFWENILYYPRKAIRFLLPKNSRLYLQIYSHRNLWKMRNYFQRDSVILLILVLVLFSIWLPSLTLVSKFLVVRIIGLLYTSFMLGLFLLSIKEGEIDWEDNFEKFIGILILINPTIILVLFFISQYLSQNQFLNIEIGITFLGFVVVYVIKTKKNDTPKRNKEKPQREIGQAIDSYDHLAILGKPGSGKSTYLQFIALTYAQNRASGRDFFKKNIIKSRFGSKKWYLPIFIPLRMVAASIKDDKTNNDIISAFYDRVLPSDLREDITLSFFRYMLQKKRCICLFDGLDEVSNVDEFRAVRKEIGGFISKYSGNKFFISSRHSGWRGGVGSIFEEAEIMDLTWNQVNQFIYSWNLAIETNRANTIRVSPKPDTIKGVEIKANKISNKLISTLNSEISIRELAKNPLLLSMICFVHYRKTLPKERFSLYEDCSRLLLEYWDIEKGLPKDDIPLTLRRKEIIMQEVAFALHSRSIAGSESGREATGDAITQIIKVQLEKFSINQNLAEDIFNKLIERTGLIIPVEKYKNLYSFSHLTFQEFFSAKYFGERGEDILSIIEEHIGNGSNNAIGWWQEVILLYTSMKKNPSVLIDDLCDTENDDWLKTNLKIASQCYKESIETPGEECERKILHQLLEIRSLGKLDEFHNELDKGICEYLFEFAQWSSFFEHVLIYQLDTEILDTKKYFELLGEHLDGNDLSIQSAFISSFLHAMRNEKFCGSINRKIIKQVISHELTPLSRYPEIYHNLCERLPNLLKNSDLVEAYLKEIAINFIDSTENINQETKHFYLSKNLYKKFQSIISNEEFSIHWKELKEKISKQLSYLLPNLPSYRGDPLRDDINIVLSYLFGLLLSFDSPEEKKGHHNELKKILKTGTVEQKVWAIKILQEFFPNDKETVEMIIGKIYSRSRIPSSLLLGSTL